MRTHGKGGRDGGRERTQEVMRLVGLPDPQRIAAAYPHELSGGQRQRTAIAIALACSPRLLLADEPTTALDVTIQAQILRLLSDLRKRLGMALVLVTHDLGVVAQTCDRVAVMYAGRIVEEAPIARIFAAPAHPYTVALLDSIPRGSRAAHPLHPIAGMPPDPAQKPPGLPLRAALPAPLGGVRDDLPRLDAASRWRRLRLLSSDGGGAWLKRRCSPCRRFTSISRFGGRWWRRWPGRRASACRRHITSASPSRRAKASGWSASRAAARPRSAAWCWVCCRRMTGVILFEGQDIARLDAAGKRALRRRVQMVFQDPYSSLNPRMRIGAAIAEPIRLHAVVPNGEVAEEVSRLLQRVGLPASAAARYPSELSGGQRQRVGIARALSLRAAPPGGG